MAKHVSVLKVSVFQYQLSDDLALWQLEKITLLSFELLQYSVLSL